MIDSSTLEKYLAGNASDEEIQQCEQFLSDAASMEHFSDELNHEPMGDSLIDTLRNLGNQTQSIDSDDAESSGLVEQIQSLVSNQKVEQQDLDRILSPPELEEELGRISHYRVIEFIAGGGMGLVFKAEDSRLQRLVCIKVLKPALAQNRDSKARFAREVKAAAKLRNARITTVLEFGEHRELPFLVMELLEGKSLREKLNAEGTS